MTNTETTDQQAKLFEADVEQDPATEAETTPWLELPDCSRCGHRAYLHIGADCLTDEYRCPCAAYTMSAYPYPLAQLD